MRRFVVFLSLWGAVGCQKRSAPEEVAPPPALELSVLELTACPPPAGFDTTKRRLVGVRVRVSGRHPQRVPANYFYASVLATDGARYLAEQPGCTPLLTGPPLGEGESREGFLNFPLPIGKNVETLVYAAPRGGAREGEGAIEVTLSAKHSPDALEDTE